MPSLPTRRLDPAAAVASRASFLPQPAMLRHLALLPRQRQSHGNVRPPTEFAGTSQRELLRKLGGVPSLIGRASQWMLLLLASPLTSGVFMFTRSSSAEIGRAHV